MLDVARTKARALLQTSKSVITYRRTEKKGDVVGWKKKKRENRQHCTKSGRKRARSNRAVLNNVGPFFIATAVFCGGVISSFDYQ